MLWLSLKLTPQDHWCKLLVNKAKIAQISLNWFFKIAGCSFLQGNPFHCSNLHHSPFLLLSSGALWCIRWSISSPIVFILWIEFMSFEFNLSLVSWIGNLGENLFDLFAVVRCTLQSKEREDLLEERCETSGHQKCKQRREICIQLMGQSGKQIRISNWTRSEV